MLDSRSIFHVNCPGNRLLSHPINGTVLTKGSYTMAARRITQLVLLLAIASMNRAFSGTDAPQIVHAPVERSGFAAPTSYDTLQAFLRDLDGNAGVSVQRIAT